MGVSFEFGGVFEVEWGILGLDVLGYEEHLDYDIAQSTNPEFGNAIVRVNLFRDHRQTVQYIAPEDAHGTSYLPSSSLFPTSHTTAPHTSPRLKPPFLHCWLPWLLFPSYLCHVF